MSNKFECYFFLVQTHFWYKFTFFWYIFVPKTSYLKIIKKINFGTNKFFLKNIWYILNFFLVEFDFFWYSILKIFWYNKNFFWYNIKNLNKKKFFLNCQNKNEKCYINLNLIILHRMKNFK